MFKDKGNSDFKFGLPSFKIGKKLDFKFGLPSFKTGQVSSLGPTDISKKPIKLSQYRVLCTMVITEVKKIIQVNT